MKKIIILVIYVILTLPLSAEAMKYRIYKANKEAKMLKHKVKLQEWYNVHHVPGTPWIICCPIVVAAGEHKGKFAVPLATETYPDNDGDDEVVDSIEPLEEQLLEEP